MSIYLVTARPDKFNGSWDWLIRKGSRKSHNQEMIYALPIYDGRVQQSSNPACIERDFSDSSSQLLVHLDWQEVESLARKGLWTDWRPALRKLRLALVFERLGCSTPSGLTTCFFFLFFVFYTLLVLRGSFEHLLLVRAYWLLMASNKATVAWAVGISVFR